LVLKYIPIFTYTKSNRGFSSTPQYSTIKQCFEKLREGEERPTTQVGEGEDMPTTRAREGENMPTMRAREGEEKRGQ